MNIGILGGGQLARMMALSCHSLGIKPYVVSDKLDSPCSGISNVLVANYDETEKISAFLKDCQAITYEFENIPLDLVTVLEKQAKVIPNTRALGITRERRKEKTFAKDLGITVPEFLFAENPSELLAKSKDFSFPAVLKTNSSGYDGKGQWMLGSWDEFKDTISDIPNVPLILEEKINFQKEFSVIAVRSSSGDIRFYDPCENTHSKGILVRTLVGTISSDSNEFRTACSYVKLLMEALSYIGVLSVEFFQRDNSILFNEYAPRVHNSGHWTIEGSHCSQFENHIRAVLGLALGSTEAISPCVMINLLGTRGQREELLKIPSLHYHWYGKEDLSERRKVGHLTILRKSVAELSEAERLVSQYI